jgi:hypothetical protein
VITRAFGVVGLVAMAAACGCASSYPAPAPAAPGIHLAVLQYELNNQIHGKYRAVFVGILEPPQTFNPTKATLDGLRAGDVPVYALAGIKEMPNVPQDEMAFVSVWARAERTYSDQVVIWGQFSLGSLEDGSYRYTLEPRDGVWQVVGTEPITLVTDCYGHWWIPS